MRLIDADALKKQLDDNELTPDGGVDINDLFNLIDYFPIVYAVHVVRCGEVCGKEKSAKHRSKTFQGIAEAMAEQWGS